MSYNRALIQSLAKDHDAEIYRRARRRALARHRSSDNSARTRTGWLLIGLGMRLVVGNARTKTQLNVSPGH